MHEAQPMPLSGAPRTHALLITTLLVSAAVCAGPAGARGGEWRRINSRHYIVHTDIATSIADDFVERLDKMHDEYARRLSAFVPADGRPVERSEVHLFALRGDYMEFTRNVHPNSIGAFAPSVNRLAAYLRDRPSLGRALQHEAFHQFAYNTIGPGMPTWLDEGMAVYFEEALWTGNRFIVGQVPPDRLKRLKADVRDHRLIPFRELMSLSQEQWNDAGRTDPERAATQYNQSWAMVHFLVHAGNGAEAYRPRLLRMLELIHQGRPAGDAFAEAFSPNIEGFQERFLEFVATLEPTEDATMLERQEVLAQMLMLLHARGVDFDSVEALREAVTRISYRLTYKKGNDSFQTAQDPSVYFQDPSGKLLPPERLFLAPRANAPLPDLVCRWKDGVQFRTRFFYGIDRKIEHDIVPEAR